MVRLSFVMLALATAAFAAQDACDVNQESCLMGNAMLAQKTTVVKLEEKEQHSPYSLLSFFSRLFSRPRTPAAPAPAPAAPSGEAAVQEGLLDPVAVPEGIKVTVAGSEDGNTPESLRHLSEVQRSKQLEERAFSGEMDKSQHGSLTQKKAWATEQLEAERAQRAYVIAADAARNAAHMGEQAARARINANKAVETKNTAEALLLEAQEMELNNRSSCNNCLKLQKTVEVAFEVASAEAQQKMEESQQSEQETENNEDVKNAKIEAEKIAQKTFTRVSEKLVQKEADQSEAKSVLQTAVQTNAGATTDVATAKAEETRAIELQGVKEEAMAGALSREQQGIKNKEEAEADYDRKQKLFHELDEASTRAAAKAKAVAAESEELSAAAKASADTANAMARSS